MSNTDTQIHKIQIYILIHKQNIHYKGIAPLEEEEHASRRRQKTIPGNDLRCQIQIHKYTKYKYTHKTYKGISPSEEEEHARQSKRKQIQEKTPGM